MSTLPTLRGQNRGNQDFHPLSEEKQVSLVRTFLGRHLGGVWIGGVWNGHFPESEKYFSGAEISRKIPEIPQREQFSPNFRLRNLKIQSPKNAIPYHTHTGLPPIFFLHQAQKVKSADLGVGGEKIILTLSLRVVRGPKSHIREKSLGLTQLDWIPKTRNFAFYIVQVFSRRN